jgi:hypothetical protein
VSAATSSASSWLIGLAPCTATFSSSAARTASSSTVTQMRARLVSRFVRPISTSSSW